MGADASRRWRQRHPEEVKKQKQAYYERHKTLLRARLNVGNLARTRQQRRDVLEQMGGRCVHCGFTDWRALQIDHIDGSGRADRAQYKNKDQFLRAVLLSPDKYQILCANCNWIKRYERTEYRWAQAIASPQMAVE